MKRKFFWGYLVLLVLSTAVRPWWAWNPRARPEQATIELPAETATGRAGSARTVRVAYEDLRPPGKPDAPVLVLLHGSPVGSVALKHLAAALRGEFRLIIPDLPGMGRSQARVPDYSVAAHARSVLDLLDALGVKQAQVLGYSMGGGVAIALGDLAPERVEAITLLAGLGVQEHELLGDYELNHAVHGLQLVVLWALDNLTPHFGLLDWFPLNTSYARNFYDTDQRPLRAALARWAGPMLIIEGRSDANVPPDAAIEHARLVPQSELVWVDGAHEIGFTEEGARKVAPIIRAFAEKVETGAAVDRGHAETGRVAAATPAEEIGAGTRWTGERRWIALALLALATLVSEDLACLSAGLLVAKGTIGFGPAAGACFAGIFAGDLLLVLAGRWFGRKSLEAAPLRWMVSAEAVRRAEVWFVARGARLIFASRFMPGTRLPTYVAAGVLRAPLRRFIGWFALACAVWTPLLVGVGALAGRGMLAWWRAHGAGWSVPVALIGAWLLVALLRGLCTWRGRRLLVSRWRRLSGWEFWPMWAVYPPVVAYILWLGLRHRGFTLFTAVNPGIGAGGGVVGESKSEILSGLAGASERVAAWTLIAPGAAEARMRTLEAWMRGRGLAFPVVLKPDAGERGAGVVIARTAEQAEMKLRADGTALIAQAYVPGVEFGVFYWRRPSDERGRILAITDKRVVRVTGDGRSTLERLILADARAVRMARFFLEAHAERLAEVPAAGALVTLAELGTHCRGALFLDGTKLVTPALEAAVEAVSRSFNGFYFGRYDVRTESAEALRRGEFTVIELNGVTSEATSIYDPANTIWRGWAMLCRQWRIAFEIAAENRARGVRPLTLRELIGLLKKRRMT